MLAKPGFLRVVGLGAILLETFRHKLCPVSARISERLRFPVSELGTRQIYGSPRDHPSEPLLAPNSVKKRPHVTLSFAGRSVGRSLIGRATLPLPVPPQSITFGARRLISVGRESRFIREDTPSPK